MYEVQSHGITIEMTRRKSQAEAVYRRARKGTLYEVNRDTYVKQVLRSK